jgi:two-component system, LuxR family, response regulator FixJ
MAISGPPIIAIVDDDDAVRSSLQFTLEVDGFVVQAYSSAAEFLRSEEQAAYQCLIVDQNMPRMTGLELVANLREQGVKIPAILVSGRVTSALKRQASEADILVIEKPFLGNGLIESIRTIVGAKPI